MANERKVVSVAEAAEMKNVTRMGIYKAIESQRIEGVHLPNENGYLYIYLDTLENWTPRQYTKNHKPKTGKKKTDS